jgi:hypothetical protein
MTCMSLISTTLTPKWMITKSIEQSSSWTAGSSRTNKGIHCILWNPNIGYNLRNNLTLDPVLSEVNLVHGLLFYFKISFNIILFFYAKVFQFFLSLRSPYENVVCISLLFHTRNMPCQFHPPWIDLSIIFSEK